MTLEQLTIFECDECTIRLRENTGEKEKEGGEGCQIGQRRRKKIVIFWPPAEVNAERKRVDVSIMGLWAGLENVLRVWVNFMAQETCMPTI